jgi:hypothetical protein
MQHLRMFLARQRGVPYCIECLNSHGAFGSQPDHLISLVRKMAESKYAGLLASVATCASCGRPRVALTFPGRRITETERLWTVHLLGAEKIVHLLIEAA